MKGKVRKRIAVCAIQAPHHYGNSRTIWDHTVLPATRQRWHSRLYPSQLRRRKMQKFGWLGVRDHPRSSETLPFDRAHMTFYSTLTEIMRLSCTVSSYSELFVESGQFLPTPPAFVTLVGSDPVWIVSWPLVLEN